MRGVREPAEPVDLRRSRAAHSFYAIRDLLGASYRDFVYNSGFDMRPIASMLGI